MYAHVRVQAITTRTERKIMESANLGKPVENTKQHAIVKAGKAAAAEIRKAARGGGGGGAGGIGSVTLKRPTASVSVRVPIKLLKGAVRKQNHTCVYTLLYE